MAPHQGSAQAAKLRGLSENHVFRKVNFLTGALSKVVGQFSFRLFCECFGSLFTLFDQVSLRLLTGIRVTLDFWHTTQNELEWRYPDGRLEKWTREVQSKRFSYIHLVGSGCAHLSVQFAPGPEDVRRPPRCGWWKLSVL